MKPSIRAVLLLLATVAVACSDDSGGDMNGGAGVSGGGAGVSGGGAGVSGGGAGASGTAGGGDPTPTTPTWTMVHTDIIINACGGPVCHSGAAGNLAMSDKAMAYAALVNQPAMGMNILGETNPTSCVDTGMMRVVPGDPDSSLLYAKVRTDMDVPCGNRMPTGGMLMPDQIEMIRGWIAAGALDN